MDFDTAGPLPRVSVAVSIMALILFVLPARSQEKFTMTSDRDEDRVEEPAPGREEVRRVIDEPIRRGVMLSLVDGLKFPLTQFGKALDKGLQKVERDHVLERAQDLEERAREQGIEPLFGGLGPGAGFAFGVNIFREHLLGTNLRLDIPLQYSTNGYAALGTRLTFPLLRDDRLFLRAEFRYQDRPQEDFFGLGPASLEADRTNFELEKRSLELTVGSRVSKGLVLGIRGGVSNANVARGTDNRFPDLQDRFAPSTLPGAEQGAELASAGAFLEWDYRNNPLDPTAGGIWTLEASYFRDTDAQDFRFMRYSLETAHYLPLDDEHGLAFRALGLFNEEKGRAAVPFFMKAVLGGKETMRGFREFRFYDDNALLFSAEYRWRIWKFADAILFVDEGQVAPEPGAFSISDFRNSHGIGLRFRSKRTAQILRVDVGHSKEGWRLYF